jgi:hypothetical protein
LVDAIYLNQINKAINKAINRDIEYFKKNISEGTILDEKMLKEFFSKLSKTICDFYRDLES